MRDDDFKSMTFLQKSLICDYVAERKKTTIKKPEIIA